jgi:hypothetical protein
MNGYRDDCKGVAHSNPSSTGSRDKDTVPDGLECQYIHDIRVGGHALLLPLDGSSMVGDGEARHRPAEKIQVESRVAVPAGQVLYGWNAELNRPMHPLWKGTTSSSLAYQENRK